ncbi:UDP-N-acetylmuramate dehydrogenase [Shewanella sp. TC10]|uniref:UDP-N-acetylmuramate dehydrogenase n=1 Tax=Shewanella sp. TC10 TaxID=1419739 RepID=UPI00129DE1A7|nr:UDP-N-acetylmuramate dehydrogenase [Shewanella sp. TC10]
MSVSLKPFNTLSLDQNCHQLVSVADVKDLKVEIEHVKNQQLPMLILGGGSNVVFTQDFEGIVIKLETKGIEVQEEADSYYITVQAGEDWHSFVKYCRDNGYHGLENLALIPGTVGAAPIQNIGAYGVEVNQFCEKVNYLELENLETHSLSNEQCQFGYRESIFKLDLKNQVVITSVEFRLPKKWKANLKYGPLQHLDANTVTPQDVFKTVCEVRNSKLPDPAKLGNVGSFFKNPIIGAQQYVELLKTYSDLVGYAQPDGSIKVAAGWLIDEAGLKGFTQGRVAVHDKQALVLVNLDNAQGAEICQLATHIIEIVTEKFGIRLEPEPRIIGSKGEVQL